MPPRRIGRCLLSVAFCVTCVCNVFRDNATWRAQLTTLAYLFNSVQAQHFPVIRVENYSHVVPATSHACTHTHTHTHHSLSLSLSCTHAQRKERERDENKLLPYDLMHCLLSWRLLLLCSLIRASSRLLCCHPQIAVLPGCTTVPPTPPAPVQNARIPLKLRRPLLFYRCFRFTLSLSLSLYLSISLSTMYFSSTLLALLSCPSHFLLPRLRVLFPLSPTPFLSFRCVSFVTSFFSFFLLSRSHR